MHYLSRLEQAIKNNWDRPALGNYRGELFTFGEFATQIAHFMYEIGRANPDEIADLKPSVGAVPGYRYGWTQGDIYDNFLIDMSTHKIIAMIDWEDCYFGDFERLFHRRHVSIASQFMDAVSREYDKLYYKKD